MKVRNATETRTFTSNNQGDSLGLVLFTICLENALRTIRQPAQNPTDIFQIAYADDVDFGSSISTCFNRE